MEILDSGTRREFQSGAVRDVQEGKGRCDLLPLDIIADVTQDTVLFQLGMFEYFNDTNYLMAALHKFCEIRYSNEIYSMWLEVAKHYEDGSKKYGDRNWEKGIPAHCYLDSGVRHYLKYVRGDKDEPHDRAFVWNILGLLWTIEHHPELNDFGGTEDD